MLPPVRKQGGNPRCSVPQGAEGGEGGDPDSDFRGTVRERRTPSCATHATTAVKGGTYVGTLWMQSRPRGACIKSETSASATALDSGRACCNIDMMVPKHRYHCTTYSSWKPDVFPVACDLVQLRWDFRTCNFTIHRLSRDAGGKFATCGSLPLGKKTRNTLTQNRFCCRLDRSACRYRQVGPLRRVTPTLLQ